MGGPIRILAREKQCTGANECISRQMTEEEIKKYGGIKPTKGKPAFHIPETPIKKEVEELKGARIIPPEKEKLLKSLSAFQGKTKAIRHATRVYSVSTTTINKWIKDYDIKFDAAGYVVREPEEVFEVCESIPLTVEIGGKTITHEREKLIEEDPKAVGDSVAEFKKQVKDLEEAIVNSIEDGNIITNKGEKLIEEAAKELADLANKPVITITGQEVEQKVPKRLGYAEHDVGDATVIFDFRKELIKVVTPENGEMTFETAIAVAEEILDVLGNE